MYAWQQPYIQAAMEIDPTKMPYRLKEAISSIEQRLLAPIEQDSDEHRAILNTSFGIAVLMKERPGQMWSFSPADLKFHFVPKLSKRTQ